MTGTQTPNLETWNLKWKRNCHCMVNCSSRSIRSQFLEKIWNFFLWDFKTNMNFLWANLKKQRFETIWNIFWNVASLFLADVSQWNQHNHKSFSSHQKIKEFFFEKSIFSPKICHYLSLHPLYHVTIYSERKIPILWVFRLAQSESVRQFSNPDGEKFSIFFLRDQVDFEVGNSHSWVGLFQLNSHPLKVDWVFSTNKAVNVSFSKT